MQAEVDQSRPKASAGHLLTGRVPDGRRHRYHFVRPNLSHCQAVVGPNPNESVHMAHEVLPRVNTTGCQQIRNSDNFSVKNSRVERHTNRKNSLGVHTS